VACVVAAHCLAGAVTYGGEQRSVALQDPSAFFSLPEGTQRHVLLRSWEDSVVPSEVDTEKAAVAMAESIKSRDDVQRAVRAIKSTLRSSAASQRRAERKHTHSLVLSSGTTMLAQIDGTNSVDGLGLDVGSFAHFEQAAARADFYEKHSKYAGAPQADRGDGEVAERVKDAAAREAAARKAERAGRQAAVNAAMLSRVKTVAHSAKAILAASGEAPRSPAAQAKLSKLLQPKHYPTPGFPFRQASFDSKPAKTWDSKKGETCPPFIPNCDARRNTLTKCHFSCGSYCQSIRGDGPCFSGDASGEMSDCKFGYRGAPATPDPSVKENSGWLEGKKYWKQGGASDCITCPVGFKLQAEFGDGSGRCLPCAEDWIDSETGEIKEEGCSGGQFAVLELGEEPGTRVASEDEFAIVPGCLIPSSRPLIGAQILAAVPDKVKDDEMFEADPDAKYLAKVQGYDGEDNVLSVRFENKGPFVSFEDGVPAEVGEGFLPMPKVGDKVTLAQDYWDGCCKEEYRSSKSGPLQLGDVGEVTIVGKGSRMLPHALSIQVLGPNGEEWAYQPGEVLKLLGEVTCPLPGYVTGNSVGTVSNALLHQEGGEEEGATEPNDPQCCCCQRDLWVGCWGWCGDATALPATMPQGAPNFRAGKGAKAKEIDTRPYDDPHVIRPKAKGGGK